MVWLKKVCRNVTVKDLRFSTKHLLFSKPISTNQTNGLMEDSPRSIAMASELSALLRADAPDSLSSMDLVEQLRDENAELKNQLTLAREELDMQEKSADLMFSFNRSAQEEIVRLEENVNLARQQLVEANVQIHDMECALAEQRGEIRSLEWELLMAEGRVQKGRIAEERTKTELPTKGSAAPIDDFSFLSEGGGEMGTNAAGQLMRHRYSGKGSEGFEHDIIHNTYHLRTYEGTCPTAETSHVTSDITPVVKTTSAYDESDTFSLHCANQELRSPPADCDPDRETTRPTRVGSYPHHCPEVIYGPSQLPPNSTDAGSPVENFSRDQVGESDQFKSEGYRKHSKRQRFSDLQRLGVAGVGAVGLFLFSRVTLGSRRTTDEQ